MLRLLILSLAISQVYGLPATTSPEEAEPPETLFVGTLHENNQTALEPYNPLDHSLWKPDSSLYNGVPMVEKHIIVDGKNLTYQDFDIPALTLEQFKEHIMSTPQFFDSRGNFLYSSQDVQKYRDSFVVAAENVNTSIALPRLVRTRDNSQCTQYDSFCDSVCTQLVSRGVFQTVNSNVYGYYHYLSDTFCGSGSISKSISVTRASGVSIGGYGQIPGFGKGWTKTLSTFLTTFGLTVSHPTDSITTGISYSGNCDAFSACFLWNRPHFSVYTGVIVTEYIDYNTNRACRNPTTTPFSTHVMHENSDPGGAASYGVCYSLGNHGCPSPVKASSDLPRCPNSY